MAEDNITPGEMQTGAQFGGLLSMLADKTGVMSLPGYTYTGQSIKLYRSIRKQPSVALARVASSAPINAAAQNLQHTGDEALAEFLDQALGTLYAGFVRECASYGVDYGYQGFEVIWDNVQVGGRSAIVPVQIKPLLADITAPLIEKDTGNVVGVLNRQQKVLMPQATWFTNDAEAGNPYGYARLENCRIAYCAWRDTMTKLGQYVTKVSGVVPIIEYPQGQSQNAEGKDVDNFDLANAVLARLGQGLGVVMPNVLAAWAEELADRGVNSKDMRAWNIDFLEAKGSHGSDFATILSKLDTYLIRGYLVPERAISEASSGTRADAEVHGNLVLASAAGVLGNITETWNEQIVKPVLRVNFGDNREGDAWAEAPAVADGDKEFIRKALGILLSSPDKGAALLGALDLDALIMRGGLPKVEDVTANTEPEATLPGEGGILSRALRLGMMANLL